MEECKLCFKSIEQGATLLDLLINRDVICPSCRRTLHQLKKRMTFHGKELVSFYVYDDFFSSLLIQYKEGMDEALSDVFLYPYIGWIRIKYYGYTLVPLPSSQEKKEERGFNHVVKMIENTKLPICDCLEKKDNKKQAFLNKNERKQMKNDIVVNTNKRIPKRILLVDDVLTTGNTMLGAIEALSGYHLKIKILVVANHPLNLKSKGHCLFKWNK